MCVSRPVLACLVFIAAVPAFAQTMLPFRLELRMVPQSGTLPGPIADLNGTQHLAIDTSSPAAADRTRRFEVQYRLIDLDPSDAITSAGLCATTLRFSATSTGPVGASFLRKAQLSQFEARVAADTPPTPIDDSGLPTGTLPFTGTHRPFRGGLQTDDVLSNGVFSGLAQLNGVDLVCLTPNDQGNTEAGYTGLEWYGLYSLEVVAPVGARGSIDLSVRPLQDPTTFNAFAIWSTAGTFLHRGSSQFINGAASVQLIPAPSALGLLLGSVLLVGRRRR